MHPYHDVLQPVQGVRHAGDGDLRDLIYPTQVQDVAVIDRTEDQVHYDEGGYCISSWEGMKKWHTWQ